MSSGSRWPHLNVVKIVTESDHCIAKDVEGLWSGRVWSGVKQNLPAAFLIGANSISRSTSQQAKLDEKGKTSKTNFSSLIPFGFVGLIFTPSAEDIDDSLKCNDRDKFFDGHRMHRRVNALNVCICNMEVYKCK